MDKPTLIKGAVHVDDRGRVMVNNDCDMTAIKRFYMLENHREGFVRAWHGHIKEAKWVVCVSGVAVECAAKLIPNIVKRTVPVPGSYNDYMVLDEDTEYSLDDPDRYILHPNGDVLYIPPGYANGHKNLVPNTRLIHFSNLAYEDTEGDDIRFDANIHGGVWEEKWR